MAGVSKEVASDVKGCLTARGLQQFVKEIALRIREVDELYPKPEAFENVRYPTAEFHLVTTGGSDMQSKGFADWNLGDRVDVTATRADVTDAGRTAA